MRFAHLDEAGISARERYAVVAGVISNPDRQWHALQRYLSDMADHLVPRDLRSDVIFHAKDLWHGARDFSRERYSRDQRISILRELAKIPKMFDIPVVVGAIDKSAHDTFGENNNAMCYAMAFGMAVVGVEYFMRHWCGDDEIASLVVEDTAEMRKHAKWGYDKIRDKKIWEEGNQTYLPVTRIVENPLFSPKTESDILQVADLAAFVSCRLISGKNDVQFLFDEFADNIVNFPSWSAAAPSGGGLMPLAD